MKHWRNIMRSVGEIYFESKFFADDDPAAQTIGKAIIGPDAMTILENRRKIKGRLNDTGYAELQKVIQRVKEIYPDSEVKVTWDKYCGCSSCPCSPGYRIKIEKGRFTDVSTKRNRFSLFVERTENGTRYNFINPKDSWLLGGNETLSLLKKQFSNEQEIGV